MVRTFAHAGHRRPDPGGQPEPQVPDVALPPPGQQGLPDRGSRSLPAAPLPPAHGTHPLRDQRGGPESDEHHIVVGGVGFLDGTQGLRVQGSEPVHGQPFREPSRPPVATAQSGAFVQYGL
ncbi:hypothetical protein [Nocardia sp. NBC_01329]|uniref:hypothetical protein n=1 Tax=Nocardia sp. NBC_01329 TaxID=2903594 RepID=UPI002E0E0EE1|nr:hypothetical protein OG405_17170 [Nocardia sp. NBC_01329]